MQSDAPETSIGRRVFLGASAWVSCLSPSIVKANGVTGIVAIDTPSFPVKTPSEVLLVAITRCANRLVAVGEQGVIIYSDDAGSSWKQAHVPVNVTLTCVCFVDQMLGWAAGHFGIILVTVDAGKSWAVQLTGMQADELTFAAAQDSRLGNNSSPGAPLALLRAQHFVQEGPDKPFLSLLPLSRNRIIAFGAYRMTMISNDGGRVWNDWSLHIYDRLSHNIYDAKKLGNAIFIACEEGLVFRSTDNGETFEPVPTPSNITLFGAVGGSDGSVVVFGVAGSCFRSTDMGNKWLPLDLGSQDNLTAGHVLRSGAILIASETGGLFLSKDNGATFKSVAGAHQASIFDFAEVDSDGLVITGGTGVVRLPAAIFSIDAGL